MYVRACCVVLCLCLCLCVLCVRWWCAWQMILGCGGHSVSVLRVCVLERLFVYNNMRKRRTQRDKTKQR
jgi:hypothetical protein